MAHNHYPSLSAAIAAVNGGAVDTVEAENAKAVVITSAGQLTKVKLLADATEGAALTVQTDIDLVLNGCTLTFTAPDAHLSFGDDTRCFIHGAGGAIVKKLDETVTTPVLLVASSGSSLQLLGGTYTLSADSTEGVLAVKADAACDLLEMTDCNVQSTNTSRMAVGIQTRAANSFLTRTRCTAKANGLSRGFMSTRKVKLVDCNVEGSSANGEANAMRIMSGELSAEGCDFRAMADTKTASTIYVDNAEMKIENSNIQADAYKESAKGVDLRNGSLDVNKSSIIATAHKGDSAFSIGIGNSAGTLLRVKDSTILADSTPNCEDTGNNTHGIFNGGTAHLENVKVFGNHSAVQNNSKLYVKGGAYTGFCHGGFYFCHGPEGEALVNDAIIRGGHYEGAFDYSQAPDITYSTVYIGGGSNPNNFNLSAYLDNCFLDASDCHRAIVVRGSSGEQNNTLNISNCFVTNGKLDEGTIRIDNETLKLNIGRGCNVTSDMFKNYYITLAPDGSFPQTPADYIEEGVVEHTNALYRKFPD